MNKSALCIFALASASFLLSRAPAQNNDRTLKVNIHYSGSGTVDETHKIFVVIWDNPDFVNPQAQGGPPLDVQPVTSKNGTATFSQIASSPVYVSAAYDPSGQWDAHSNPPKGSSLGLYSKEPGKAAPVDIPTGKSVTVDLSFDDSFKMQ